MPVTLVQSSLPNATEKDMIQKLGTLNPPRVYSLGTSSRQSARSEDFRTHSPLQTLQIRCEHDNPGNNNPQPGHARPSQHVWKYGLQAIASALEGHQFPGHKHCTLAAWRLAPSGWQYVAHRLNNCEEMRRKRTMSILRKISRVRCTCTG